MSDSTFNPDAFIGTQTDQVGETHYFPIPKAEYVGQIDSVQGRQFNSNKTGLTYTVLEVRWVVPDEEVKRITNQEKPTARQTIFLDLTGEGGLDFSTNKNVPLSKLRDAVGQNKKGRPWAPSMLIGQTARVFIDHDVNDETGEPRAVVTKVAAA